jgi:hypothetical protein
LETKRARPSATVVVVQPQAAANIRRGILFPPVVNARAFLRGCFPGKQSKAKQPRRLTVAHVAVESSLYPFCTTSYRFPCPPPPSPALSSRAFVVSALYKQVRARSNGAN